MTVFRLAFRFAVSIILPGLFLLSNAADTLPAAKPPLEAVEVAELSSGTEQLDLFLLIGQSNMKGRGIMPEEPMRDPQIVAMHLTTDEWFLARHPLHLIGSPEDFSGQDNAGVGPGLMFAATLKIAQPKVRIGLIPSAKGGSNIGQWRKGRSLYDEAVRRTKLALSQGPAGKTRIAGVLWLQGESDATNEQGAERYPGALGELIDNLRADLDSPELPFVACTIGEMKEKRVEQLKEINAILLDIESLRPHAACVDSREFANHIGDGVHFDTATQEEHGRRYAAKYLELTRE